MSKTIIAIDPGASGGIAWMHHGCRANSFKMPETEHDLAELLESITCQFSEPVECLLEDVHAMPGQGVTSMFSFGCNFGIIRGVLAALKIPYRRERPQSWQKKVGGLPADKKERKDRLKAIAQARYPHLKVTLATADALCMLMTMEQ